MSDTLHRSKYSSRDDEATPRNLPYHTPIVEDENDALAKEAGSVVSSVASEEPTNRGDPDQYPILLPVDEHIHNPERRFIIIPNTSDSSSDVSSTEKKSSERRGPAERAAEPDPEPPFYEANTCRKYESPPAREDKTGKKDTRPEAEHRRSRPGDLPPIITDSGIERRSFDSRREKSTRTDSRGDNYYSPRLSSASSRTPRERLSTPEVIEHATNGRDRSYYRGGSSPDRHGRGNGRRYKEKEYKSANSSSPTLQKQRTSELPGYTRRGSKENHDSSRQHVHRSSFKSDRQVPASIPSQSDRDSSSQYSSTSRDTRVPPQYSDTFSSSEDEPRPQADSRRRRPGAPTGKADYLTTPVESGGAGRRKSRGQSSLPSPRLSQNSLSDPYSSSSSSRSATFPREPVPVRGDDRAVTWARRARFGCDFACVQLAAVTAN
ncbi:hypothetical protein NUW58_g3309 [Xylaria curta]|uniref:Uncharacterized protein n=1 Tax=Xylaria curta TaxID=42375 RepID=A0ACC1PE97_9PEZI|nr:hypothetical protein NUW58_g3309 [Xylaria curta]